MTRRRDVMCDVCETVIYQTQFPAAKGWWATFKLGLFSDVRMKLRKWGIVDYHPVSDGWTKRRIDLCDDCWQETLAEVKRRVNATSEEHHEVGP